MGTILWPKMTRWLVEAGAGAWGATKGPTAAGAWMAEDSTAAVVGGTGTADVTGAAEGAKLVVVVLPGPPRELQPMWRTAVATPAVQQAIAGRTVYRQETVRMFGLPESGLAETLRDAYRSAFTKLARMNKADPDPHPVVVWLFDDHPPIRQRLALADVVAPATRDEAR